MSDLIDLRRERIKRWPSQRYVMVPREIQTPFVLRDLYGAGARDLQRIGVHVVIPGVKQQTPPLGITSSQARLFAAQLLVAADALDARASEQP